MKKRAKIFICHSPNSLFFFKDCAKIVRKYDKKTELVAFKVNHIYFKDFDFEPYRNYFDRVEEFDFISYKKNVIKGYWEIFKFVKKLKKNLSYLSDNFESIDVFLVNSGWLPINVMLYYFAKQKNIKNISRFIFTESEYDHLKTDKKRTFFANLYTLFVPCYKVKALKNSAGRFADFSCINVDKTFGKPVEIVNPFSQKAESDEQDIFPYPADIEEESKEKRAKKDMIIVFGDANLYKSYPGFFDYNKDRFEKEMKDFFRALENKYRDCRLYYKLHPGDNGRVMSGINRKKYEIMDNSYNVQTIIDKFRNKIKANYTFSSTAALFPSFFRIPSYTFYKAMFNKKGIERMNIFFEKNNLKSKFLFHIKNINEIGIIDDLAKSRNIINQKKIEQKQRKILNI